MGAKAALHCMQQARLTRPNLFSTGYDDSMDGFGWDGPAKTHPMQHYSSAQFNRNPPSQQNRQQQHPTLARQGFSSELRHKDIGSGDLASTMSLPTSSGTEGRGGGGLGGGPRALNKRKGGRSRKAPTNDSQIMQRCLDVVEQLLEEEDAEPFADPASGSYCLCMPRCRLAAMLCNSFCVHGIYPQGQADCLHGLKHGLLLLVTAARKHVWPLLLHAMLCHSSKQNLYRVMTTDGTFFNLFQQL